MGNKLTLEQVLAKMKYQNEELTDTKLDEIDDFVRKQWGRCSFRLNYMTTR